MRSSLVALALASSLIAACTPRERPRDSDSSGGTGALASGGGAGAGGQPAGGTTAGGSGGTGAVSSTGGDAGAAGSAGAGGAGGAGASPGIGGMGAAGTAGGGAAGGTGGVSGAGGVGGDGGSTGLDVTCEFEEPAKVITEFTRDEILLSRYRIHLGSVDFETVRVVLETVTKGYTVYTQKWSDGSVWEEPAGKGTLLAMQDGAPGSQHVYARTQVGLFTPTLRLTTLSPTQVESSNTLTTLEFSDATAARLRSDHGYVVRHDPGTGEELAFGRSGEDGSEQVPLTHLATVDGSPEVLVELSSLLGSQVFTIVDGVELMLYGFDWDFTLSPSVRSLGDRHVVAHARGSTMIGNWLDLALVDSSGLDLRVLRITRSTADTFTFEEMHQLRSYSSRDQNLDSSFTFFDGQLLGAGATSAELQQLRFLWGNKDGVLLTEQVVLTAGFGTTIERGAAIARSVTGAGGEFYVVWLERTEGAVDGDQYRLLSNLLTCEY